MNNILSEPNVVIIAELSCNHLQNFDIAVRTIEEMKKAGADYVKVQNDNPDGGITINCSNDYFRIDQGTLWDGETLHSLYKKTYTPWDWLPKLQNIAHELGLGYFSTPSDLEGVDFLEKMNIPAYKIASFEITDIPLIRYIASKQKPIIISTGVALEKDISLAIKACREVGNEHIALLKCTSSYPAKLEEANLLTLPDMKQRFGVTIGVSDHSMSNVIPITATALGARIIEKHFILDRSMGGPDAAFSMEPQEFKEMVRLVRDVEKALGKITYNLTPKGWNNRRFSRSLFIVEDMSKGEILTSRNLRSIRPGDGLPPVEIDNLLGRKINQDLKKGTPMRWEYVE